MAQLVDGDSGELFVGRPWARLHNGSSGDLPTIAGAKRLSTDEDTATERAEGVLVVLMMVPESTFDADADAASAMVDVTHAQRGNLSPPESGRRQQ